MNYTANYFKQKFQAIPEEKWCENHFFDGDGAYCAQGHCGIRDHSHVITLKLIGSMEASESYYPEWVALIKLFGGMTKDLDILVAQVNNGTNPKYQQSTPKARILAALDDIIAEEDLAGVPDSILEEVNSIKDDQREPVLVFTEDTH